MSDIVQRLRQRHGSQALLPGGRSMFAEDVGELEKLEAAAEIEKLRILYEQIRAELKAALNDCRASRHEALEEAAQVAESYEPRCDTCPRGAADAIRALKEQAND